MNLQELIASDPDGVGYSTMVPALIASDIMERRHAVNVPVDLDNILSLLGSRGAIGKVLTGKRQANSSSASFFAMVSDFRVLGYTELDVSDSEVVTILDGLVSENVIVEKDKADIVALSGDVHSLARIHLGVDTVYPEDVEAVL